MALGDHGSGAGTDSARQGCRGGPYVLRSSVAQRCCPWGVRSPRGEFLRERGRLKIVALGSKPVLVLFGPLPAPSLWGVGQRVPFLDCSCLLCPDPTTPFSPDGTHCGPWERKRPTVGVFCSSGHPGRRAEASGPFSSWFLTGG